MRERGILRSWRVFSQGKEKVPRGLDAPGPSGITPLFAIGGASCPTISLYCGIV
jgi:hypothetical protein